MKPTVGRIVHYFERDKKHPQLKIVPRAAMITAIIGELGLPDTVMLALIEKTRRSRVEIEQAVMLTVFFPGANPAPMLDPVFQGTERGCWNWPEREPAASVNIAETMREAILSQVANADKIELHEKSSDKGPYPFSPDGAWPIQKPIEDKWPGAE